MGADRGAGLEFLDGGGDVGALMRAHDWSSSPLGEPGRWPPSLRAVVALLLPSKFPMFVAWGPDLGFLYNDAYAQILGRKHPRALGARFHDIWAEIWEDIWPLIEAAMAGQASYRENLPLLMNRKGFDEHTWFTFSYSPVRDETGAVAGMFCAVAETTALVLAETRFRNLADAMPQLVWTAGADGRVDYFNARRAQYRGIAEDTDGHADWAPMIHPDDRAATTKRWQRALASGGSYTCEHRLALADGRWAWHMSRAEGVRGPSGVVERWYGTATDIAELKAAQEEAESLNATLERRIEEALAERRVLADLVEGTESLVQVMAPDYRWLAVNRTACDEFERIFGVRPRPGDSLLEALADEPERLAELTSMWRRALAGERFVQTSELGDPARARRKYEMKFDTLRDRDGRQIGAYQFAQDVTERLRDQARLAEAENQLRQAQKMETIGQLTGGVAHDFNNLLTPIVGALDLLKRTMATDERAQRLIAGGLRSAERAQLLVQRLLAFSRRQHLDPRAVDIGSLVRGMADLLGRALGPGVALIVEVEPALPLAQVDPNQLELALLNLAVNARDAMDEGGTLHIAARRAERAELAKPKPERRYVSLSVTDSGRGMDTETLQRATEPFFTTKEVGQGTGLGLSSVQGLAEQSGGEFRLASAKGRGTTATLFLPASDHSRDDAPEGSGPDVETARAAGTTVLLVDDEDLVRATTADMLADAGYRVSEASSAYQALQMLEAGVDAEVLVTDYAMPGMTGAELLRKARRLRPELAVLMITGYATAVDRDAGRVARLAKPYRRGDLARAVAGAIAMARSPGDAGAR